MFIVSICCCKSVINTMLFVIKVIDYQKLCKYKCFNKIDNKR